MSRLLTICSVFLILFAISNSIAFKYNQYSPEIKVAFEKAGDNAGELQKVIDYYTKLGDKQKLEAVIL